VIRDELADARYQARAWAQSVAWLNALAGLGMVATGYARRDATLFASGVAVTVAAFLPRLRGEWVYEVARTWAMKRGWVPVPPDELPTLTTVVDTDPRRE
jgi:hypothetical protein